MKWTEKGFSPLFRIKGGNKFAKAEVCLGQQDEHYRVPRGLFVREFHGLENAAVLEKKSPM